MTGIAVVFAFVALVGVLPAFLPIGAERIYGPGSRLPDLSDWAADVCDVPERCENRLDDWALSVVRDVGGPRR